jgi:hypothetical protein
LNAAVLLVVIAMIGTRVRSAAIAFVAVIEPDAVLFVPIVVVVMRVAGCDPYAARTNVDSFRKCSRGKNEQRGGDCS